VIFKAPASNGGSRIIFYTAASNPGGVTARRARSPIKVKGLTNGTPYSFTVTAVNAVGAGQASAQSSQVIPATVPTAPRSVTAAAGNALAMVSFTAPASDGGSVVTGYSVVSHPGGKTASGTASPITVTRLTNGTAYKFTVRAVNVMGTGPSSTLSNSVKPATVPGVPRGVTATAGSAQATVRFTAPVSNGGSPITGYLVTSSPEAHTAQGTASPITVTGLTNGTAYTFTVAAISAVGPGPASSPSNSVTPGGSPAGTAFPLKVSGRHLVDQNGTPFLMVGDSAWSLIAQLDNSDVDTYLADRRSRGFNTIIVNLIEHKFASNAPADYYGDQPFTTPGDLSTPNEAYFSHADWVINQAAAYGMLVILAPAYMGYQCDGEGWCQEMLASGTAKCREYGAYVGARYASFPNILWMDGIDVKPATYNATAVMQAVVTGIKSHDSKHLHTADCTRNSTAYACYNYSWLNVNDIYTDCSNVANYTSRGYKQVAKPIYFNEGVYEGEGASQRCLDTQMYIPVLGGAFGSVFGNNPIWLFGSGWQSALGLQGSINQANFGAFFQSIPWHELVPDYGHTVLTSGYGSLSDASYVGCARTSDGNYIIAYLPTQTTVTINLSKMSSSQVTAQWFNPSTAEYTAIGTFPNTGTRNFRPSASGDWVLLLTGQ
jgi:hypothetical protein